MALLGSVERGLLARWWGLIEQGAAAGNRITDVVSAGAQLARDLGQPLSFQQAQGLATLAGFGFRIERASEALLAADSAAVLEPSMMAQAPWGRDLAEQNLSPSWQVKFTMTFRDGEGNIQTEVKTSMFNVEFPETVGDLADAVNQDAQGFATKYGVELISAEPFQILAV